MKRLMQLASILIVASVLLSACSTPTPEVKVVTQIVKEVVEQTVVVEGTPQVIEKEVTRVVEVEKVVTATSEPAPAGPVKGGTVVIVRDQEPNTLVQQWSTLDVAWEVADMINEPLFRWSEVGEFAPFLAKEVPTLENGGISEDGLTFTFHLREDVKWHDGEPFTAEDVIFTLDVVQDPNSGVMTYPPNLESVETPDEYTVVMKLPSIDAAFLSRLTLMPILPEHALKDVDNWQTAEYLYKPWPGTGPFQFVEWEAGSHILVEKNSDYYRGEPYLDSIVYQVTPNVDARLAALRSGEAQMSFYLIGEDVLNARDIPGLKVYETPAHCAFIFFFNLRDPFLRDMRTRVALNHAVDKPGIVETVVHGLGSPKWSPLVPASWAYIDVEHKYTYDPEKAKALLEEAGWKDTDGDGVREAHGVEGVPDGTKLAFSVINIAGQAERLQICQIVQQQWKEIGVELEIETMDVSTWVSRRNSFEFTVAYGYNAWDPDPGLAAQQTWYSVGTQNPHGLDTIYPDIDALLEEAMATVDIGKRKAMYAEFQELIAERATDFLMYDRNWYNAASEKVHNFKPIPGGGQHTWNSYEWWLEP